MSTTQTLPELNDMKLTLDVFRHDVDRAGEQPLKPGTDYGNGDRLEILGESAFNHAISEHFFSKRPLLTRAQILDKKKDVLSDENLEQWAATFDLKEVLNTGAKDVATVLEDPKEVKRFLYRLIGAVFFKQGPTAVLHWVSRLIDPEDPVTVSTPPSQDVPLSSPASSPLQAPPPSSPGAAANVTLALLNQKASQLSMSVTYPAESVGPPHSPTWTVRCCINNVEKGLGRGKSQKLAKEEAARQAWVSMNW